MLACATSALVGSEARRQGLHEPAGSIDVILLASFPCPCPERQSETELESGETPNREAAQRLPGPKQAVGQGVRREWKSRVGYLLPGTSSSQCSLPRTYKGYSCHQGTRDREQCCM
ncbi:hypothetical protein V8C42DRAFT_316473 [Trichoderma barbatum]